MIGAAVGFSLGALTGLIVDLSRSGVNIDFVDEVSGTLLPGTTAVVAEVEESWETPVNTRLGNLGGLVFRRLRSEVVEDQLERLLAHAAAVPVEAPTAYCFTETSAWKYFSEMVFSVPSALRSARALLTAATRSESLRVATTCSETSPVRAAIFTEVSPVDFW